MKAHRLVIAITLAGCGGRVTDTSPSSARDETAADDVADSGVDSEATDAVAAMPEAPPPWDGGVMRCSAARRGAYVDIGTYSYEATEATEWRASSHDFGGTVSVSIGEAASIELRNSTDGKPLQVGTYENAVRMGLSGSGAPGLDIGVLGGSCNMFTGSFHVYDIQWADPPLYAKKTLSRVTFTFDQRCNDGRFRRGCVHWVP